MVVLDRHTGKLMAGVRKTRVFWAFKSRVRWVGPPDLPLVMWPRSGQLAFIGCCYMTIGKQPLRGVRKERNEFFVGAIFDFFDFDFVDIRRVHCCFATFVAIRFALFPTLPCIADPWQELVSPGAIDVLHDAVSYDGRSAARRRAAALAAAVASSADRGSAAGVAPAAPTEVKGDRTPPKASKLSKKAAGKSKRGKKPNRDGDDDRVRADVDDDDDHDDDDDDDRLADRTSQMEDALPPGWCLLCCSSAGLPSFQAWLPDLFCRFPCPGSFPSPSLPCPWPT